MTSDHDGYFFFAAAEQTLHVTRSCSRAELLLPVCDVMALAVLSLSSLFEFRATTSTDLSEGCRKEAVIAGSSKEQDRKSTMLFSRTGSPWAVSPGLPGKCLHTDRSPSIMCLRDQWKEEISSKSSALCVHVPCILPHSS